ncbi:MAG: cupin domain-containing protein [Chloroflexi bacterium]|nr:cupin domain-containing protein [Chloroflexota bacterium]
MPVVRGREAREFEVQEGYVITALLSPSTGAREIMAWRARSEPGHSNPLHRHDREEAVLVTAGSLQATVGGEQFAAQAGDAFVIPANTSHQVEAQGDRPCEIIVAMPVGTRFFYDDGRERPNPPWTQ